MLEQYTRTDTGLDRIHNLYSALLSNSLEIDNLFTEIEKLDPSKENEVDRLEKLYSKEFFLCMENISIFEDLMRSLDNEPVTEENRFELKRIRRDAEKLVKVEVVEL